MLQTDFAESPDESLKALGIILDAWDAGTEAGLASEVMAYAALFTALTDLVGHFGEDAVAKLTTRLVERIHNGEFTAFRSLQ